MPCKCIYELDFNVLTMVNEGLQRLIIDALMINVTFTDSQESKWEFKIFIQMYRIEVWLKLGLLQEYMMYEKHD